MNSLILLFFPPSFQGWLDHKNVPLEDAIKLLLPVQKLGWHPVGTYVNNSRSKVKECNKPVDPR